MCVWGGGGGGGRGVGGGQPNLKVYPFPLYCFDEII